MLLLESFSHHRLLMVFHWSLSDNKFPQVYISLLGVLTGLNNTGWPPLVLWFISLPIPSPITNETTVTSMSNSFLGFFLVLWQGLNNFSFLFSFISTITRSGLLASIGWSVSMSKFQRILYVSFSWTGSWLCIYYSFVWSNFNFLHNFALIWCIYYYYYYYYYYHYYSLKVFHISVSWRFFTGASVTASLLKPPRLFSVFWPFSIMLSFGWSPLVRQLPIPPVPLIIL